jgi:acyl-CoA synthetase (AMP-forming)/AMP-acid ligase II
MNGLPQALEQLASAHPSRVPFRSEAGTALTYRNWLEQAKGLSAALRMDAGVRPGDRVLIVFDQDQWHYYPIAYVATLAVGATVVTVSPQDVGLQSGTVAPALTLTCGRNAARAVPHHHKVQHLDVHRLSTRGRAGGPWPLPIPNAIAEVVHTSGTTGRRMAVGCTHANLSSMLHQRIDSPIFGFTKESVLVHHIPMGTQAAQRVLLESLRSPGQTSICVTQPNAEILHGAILKNSARFVGLVPTTARRLIRGIKDGLDPLASVEWVSVGSSHLDHGTFTQLTRVFPNARLLNMYGVTEAGAARIRTPYDERPGSVGRPEPGTLLEIRDRHGRKLSAGEVGELWLCHMGAPARFYIDDDAATLDVFQNGWVRTGDLARIDLDGYVYLVDRIKDVIVSAGEKVGSYEIERCLVEHPGVQDAAVFGTPASLLGERVTAAIILDKSVLSEQDAREVLLQHCLLRLNPRQVPTRFVVLDELPMGSTGKVLKRHLREKYGSGDSSPIL